MEIKKIIDAYAKTMIDVTLFCIICLTEITILNSPNTNTITLFIGIFIALGACPMAYFISSKIKEHEKMYKKYLENEEAKQ